MLDKECGFRGGKNGKLKLETSDNIPLEAYFISSKVYSIALKKRAPLDILTDVLNHNQDECEYKRAAKGCVRCQLASVLTQSVYKDVYEGTRECPSVSACTFRFNESFSAMVTQVTNKVPLTMRCDKRFWFNKDLSVAYDHLLSYLHGYRDGDVICVRGGKIVHLQNNAVSNENDDVSNENDAVSNENDAVLNEADIELFNVLNDLMTMGDEYDSDSCNDVNDDDGPRIVFDTNQITDPISQSSQKIKIILF